MADPSPSDDTIDIPVEGMSCASWPRTGPVLRAGQYGFTPRRGRQEPLCAAVDGKLAAVIAVAEPLKPSAREAIAALHALDLKVAMVTGDNRQIAEAIARQVGIDEIVAEVLPDAKVEAVRRLRADHGKIAFVGDGINGAPDLAEADIGLTIGPGTDIAIESADVVLTAGDLRGVVNAIDLSQATLRNIKQNLF